MNKAYTERYRTWREQCEGEFCPENRVTYRPGTGKKDLGGGWQVNVRYYEGEVSGCTVHGSECDLTDAEGKVRYQWRNINNDGEFFQIIHHSNGRDYLVFRQDLYGYSVLDMGSMESFQYLPDKSFPDENEAGGETFIWTEVYYHPKNNYAAVSGCFWACPSSVMVVDFSDPIEGNEHWTDIHRLIDPEYDVYDDIDFVEWRDDGSLVFVCFNVLTSASEGLVLPVSQFSGFVKAGCGAGK